MNCYYVRDFYVDLEKEADDWDNNQDSCSDYHVEYCPRSGLKQEDIITGADMCECFVIQRDSVPLQRTAIRWHVRVAIHQLWSS